MTSPHYDPMTGEYWNPDGSPGRYPGIDYGPYAPPPVTPPSPPPAPAPEPPPVEQKPEDFVGEPAPVAPAAPERHGGGGAPAPRESYDGGGMAAELRAAYDALKNAPSQIEQLRQLLGRQFMAGMQPMQDYYQPALDQMAARGVLNSSVTENALASIQNDINRAYAQALAGANTWAAQGNLDLTMNTPGIAASVLAALNDLERVNQGWSQLDAQIPLWDLQRELMPWQVFLPYM